MLELDGVTKTFGGLVAVDHVTATIQAGKVTGVIGPNGAGKSTLFNVIAGMFPPDEGTVTLNGARIDGEPAFARAGRGMARSFQVSRVIEGMTVAEILLAAARPQIKPQPWTWLTRRAALSRQELGLRDKAFAMMERFGIDQVADNRISEISGGQRKLLDLARALMADPEIVLLDEPGAGVNPVLVEQIGDFILELNSEGLTFVVIEHNMSFLEQIADRVLVMAEGRLLTDGTLQEVTAHPEVLEAYLGKT